MTKISDKLAKVNEDFTVTMYENGCMFEISGRDSAENYKNTKIICSNMEELLDLVSEATTMERDN